MANKKKALRASPFDDVEIEASIFGQASAGSGRKESHKARMPAKSQEGSKVSRQQDAGKRLSQQVERAPMEKIMMRLPKSLALEFQQVYLQLAAWHLETHGKKLYVQDCHVDAIRDWVKKQKEKLADKW